MGIGMRRDVRRMSESDDLVRAVAIEVMGWTITHSERSPTVWWYSKPKGSVHEHEWHPDTDIADAWIVIERMRELGYYGWVDWFERDDEHKDFYALFGKLKGADNEEWTSMEKTAPLAICRAALAVVRAGK